MSGLSLNCQLLENNARFLCNTKTAPAYHLYAFENMDPPRPGLVRQEQGDSLEVEVWEIPLIDFGKFVSLIPEPLGIGMVKLANNELMKGFICEAYAVKAAVDITHYGSWRTYIEKNKN